MRTYFRSICLVAITFLTGVSILPAQPQEQIIDNAKVRVLRVSIQPGETSKTDHPELNRVVVWLQQGSGNVISSSKQKISWKQNEAKWETAGSTHPMQLETKAPVSEIVIELKGKGDGHAATSPQNPWLVDPRHYKIGFENNDVRVSRVRIGPKETTALHEHSLNRIVVYLSAMDFQIDPEGKPSQHSVQKPGAIVWGDPARHTEHNLSDKPFEAVVIEPKF